MSELTRRRSLERLSKPDLITKVIETEREMHARELHHFEEEQKTAHYRTALIEMAQVAKECPATTTVDAMLARALAGGQEETTRIEGRTDD